MASKCTSLLLHRKPVQQKYRQFCKDFKPKNTLYLRVNETKITSKNAFNENHSGTESNNDRKTLFQVLLQICDRCFNP